MGIVFIKDIAYFLPDNIINNSSIVAEFPEWSVAKIADKVGILSRRVSGNYTATDMAVLAAEKLFSKNQAERNHIDFVLFCTQSPDYKLPSSACIIQDRLGIQNGCGALDFNLGCSGYVYGLALAKGLLQGGIAKNVLLLTADTYTHYIHPKDKGNRTIFGDAATATLISSTGFAEIGDFVLGTDGSGADHLIVKTGGAKYPEKKDDLVFDENGNPISSDYLFMNGSEIFLFTIQKVPKMIRDVLLKNHLQKDDVRLYVFHQANKYILEHLRKKIDIPEEQFFLNIQDIGNTVSSTIPIALCDAKEQELLHGPVLLAGFGVGFSWGGTIIRCG